MMQQAIHIIFICTSLVMGWTIATQDKMVLNKARLWAEEKKSKWLDGLLLCHWCMPSSWALPAYIIAYLSGVVHGAKILWLYPVVVCASSVMCGMIWELYQVLNMLVKYLVNAEKVKYFEVKNMKDKYRAEQNRHGKPS